MQKKIFLGKRYKRYLFLRSRKGKNRYLKGNSIPDQVTANNWLWVLSGQENILQQSLMAQGEKVSNPLLTQQTALPEDEIRSELAKEFVEKLAKQEAITNKKDRIRWTEHVLGDIERIFDPSLPLKERYFLAVVIETGLTGFFKHYLQLIYNKISSSQDKLRFREKKELIKKLNPFIYHAYEYSDFLSTASLTKDKASLTSYKYEAMENLLLFLEYLGKLSRISLSNRSFSNIVEEFGSKPPSYSNFSSTKRKKNSFFMDPLSFPKSSFL